MNKEQDILLKEGKMLPVMEHFYTLQGEGAHTGKAAYFIRLGGCDVGCHWCDVKESWDPELHPLMNAAEIAETAASHCKTIVLTGGEPLMWNLDILTSRLKELGCTIHIETSGAYPMSGHLDWITLSPKKQGFLKKKFISRPMNLRSSFSISMTSHLHRSRQQKFLTTAGYIFRVNGAKEMTCILKLQILFWNILNGRLQFRLINI